MAHAEGSIEWGIVAIFAIVYIGMVAGGLPRLKLNRPGIALLGAIAMVGLGAISTEQAARAVDLPTILLLFSFMVLSAQMRLGGFYTAVTRRVADFSFGRNGMLGAIIAVAGCMSAVFSNDIVCLALTPVVVQLCRQRRLDPVPFLLGLACAANIGSAATLIGNPQNMLIGSVMHLPFDLYLQRALVPVGLSLLLLWLWLAWGPGRSQIATAVEPPAAVPVPQESSGAEDAPFQAPPFDRWQTIKGLAVAVTLMLVFLFTNWSREVAALVGAGFLLLSRRFHSSRVMGFVDWELLVLFMGLFVVNHAFESTGLAARLVAAFATHGIVLSDGLTLFLAATGLSNLVSNVPAVMLLLPHLHGIDAGVTLALVSTLAGNLLLVGSIANLIVADLAQKEGVTIDWRSHGKIGVPVTLLSLVIVWFWMQMM